MLWGLLYLAAGGVSAAAVLWMLREDLWKWSLLGHIARTLAIILLWPVFWVLLTVEYAERHETL